MFKKNRDYLIRHGVLKPTPFEKQVKEKLKVYGVASYAIRADFIDHFERLLKDIEGIEWRFRDSKSFYGSELDIWIKEEVNEQSY